ncbi:MAG: glycoside hydrolase family 65 protein, partial [Blastococcus sp.]
AAVLLVVETSQSHIRIAEAARTRMFRNGARVAENPAVIGGPGRIGHEIVVDVDAEDEITVEKTAAIATSRDHAVSDTATTAVAWLETADSFDEMLRRHVLAWAQLWARFPIELRGGEDDRVLPVLRLHIFHLLQTVSPHTPHLDVGVPARGWHGEAYRGHIFWDEMFIFPFLNFERPILASALLEYRHARLGAARAAARAAGYDGAMFPWQSGSNGGEETQEVHLNPKSGRWLPDHSRNQRHVNIAIAYNVWQHYMVTGSTAFLRFTGAELLVEIARFWASVATYNSELGRYEILGVMGPDEYHEAYPDSGEPGLRNNTYTNVMAVWVLQRALEALEVLPAHYRQELVEELMIRDEELDRWRDITRKMKVVFHADGVLTQFEGYEDLLEFDWEGYRERYGNIQRLDRLLEAEGDSADRYKLAKQADMLMLLFLLSRDELRELLRNLGYEMSTDQLARTVTHHLERTSHGSTLSGVVTAWVLARYQPEEAWRFLQQALQSDVADVQGGTTAEGVHLGAMAGTVDIVLRCLTGMRARGPVLRFDPALPPEVKQLKFSVHYRGHRIDVSLAPDHMRLGSRPGVAAPISVLVRDQTVELAPGQEREVSLGRTP